MILDVGAEFHSQVKFILYSLDQSTVSLNINIDYRKPIRLEWQDMKEEKQSFLTWSDLNIPRHIL